MPATVACALLLAILSSCGPVGEDSSGAAGNEAVQAREAEAIAVLQEQWVIATNAGDLQAMEAFYAEEAIVVPPETLPLVGTGAIIRWIDQRREESPFEIETSSHEIVVAGDWAFDRGAYALHLAPRDPAAAAPEYGNYLRLWRKQDGSWKIARDIWNRLPDLALSPDAKRVPKRP